MLVDGRDVPSGATFSTDVCIVGTGPAGLTIARELSGTGAGLVLLETGDLTRKDEAEALRRGVAGDAGYDPFEVRHKQFGGTANGWGLAIGPRVDHCRYAPFDEVDFERRDWLPDSGWPFAREELVPYYRRACDACGIGPFEFDGAAWERPDAPRLPFPGGRLDTTMFQFGSKEHFVRAHRELGGRSERVKCFLNATAVELHADEGASAVRWVEAATLAGGRFRVEADTFVLAAGGIDNPRLLLLSNRAAPQGLGNRHGLVGRFFMDHYLVHSGYLIPRDRGLFDRAGLYDMRIVDGTAVQGKLSVTSSAMREERLLNSGTYLLPRNWTTRLKDRGLDSLGVLRRSLRSGRIPTDLPHHLGSLAGLPVYAGVAAYRRMTGRRAHFPLIIAGGWSDLPDKSREFAAFEIWHLVEQSPHPENRLTLSDEVDRLGCRVPRVDCVLRQPDVDSVRRIQELLAGEFRRSGLGRLALTPGPSPHVLNPNGSGHHTGATRMHADPRRGVVDANGKVHDLANLYVAGSSVFPTASYANPTLTIVAMAIRLADHLRAARGRSTVAPIEAGSDGR